MSTRQCFLDKLSRIIQWGLGLGLELLEGG